MIQKINELASSKIDEGVSVDLVYDNNTSKVFPKWVLWNKRFYPIVKVGLHHTRRRGRTLYHIFSVASKSLFFRLVLNTDNLHWKVEEIVDGF